MSGYWGDLSPQQEEALKQVRAMIYMWRMGSREFFFHPPLQQFKEAVADFPDKPEDSDPYYLRWLRGEDTCLNMTDSLSLTSFTCSQELQCGKGSGHVQRGKCH